jgi:hypothetical protein
MLTEPELIQNNKDKARITELQEEYNEHQKKELVITDEMNCLQSRIDKRESGSN